MDILGKLSIVRSMYRTIDITDKRCFIWNMSINAYMMAASEQLIKTAIQILENSFDDYDLILKKYYQDHLKEEENHFSWLKDDLSGEDISFNWDGAELAGLQYYLMQHVSPCALLGYMCVLECFPMNIENINKLENIYGEKLMRTAKYHAINDIEHSKELLEIIHKAPPEKYNIIIENALHVMHKLGLAQQNYGDSYAKCQYN